MEASGAAFSKIIPHCPDRMSNEEYSTQSKLLMDFTNFSSINKAWVIKSGKGNSSQAMFSLGQTNMIENKQRTLILSSHIMKGNMNTVEFHWSPFPIEMIGVSAVVPSPSGLKLLIVRNKENGSSTKLEIWGSSMLSKEIHIPESIHGPIYTDGWFEGISWNYDEVLVAYVAEVPCPSKPVFDGSGYRSGDINGKTCGTWKGQGEWEEDWGETYSGKRKPALFVLNINSEDVRAVQGIDGDLSVGQVVWAPSSPEAHDQWLVFVAWPSYIGDKQVSRKLGMKYCYNRPCALYAVRCPFTKPNMQLLYRSTPEDLDAAVKLTPGISSAYFPRFSPDGRTLLFLSAKSSVDSGVHAATNSLHRMDWPTDRKLTHLEIVDVIPVIMFAEDGCFPGLYCSKFLDQPWLSDGYTLILSSIWGSVQVILSIDIMRRTVSRISPVDSSSSWNVIAVDGDNICAVSSTLVSPPQLKYGCLTHRSGLDVAWEWLNIASPLSHYSQKVELLLSSLQCFIMKIPVKNVSEELPEGAKRPFEAIFVSSKAIGKTGSCNPVIMILHGGPHSNISTSYSKSFAFLSVLGYNLLIVNYRGSLGFGEEALQSLPGKIGEQDVSDVLAALEHVTELGLVDPSKVAILGGSHGGFLTTHLIGQAPDKFAAAVVRNPVCNLGLMAGTTDIPDWCYVESYGSEGKVLFPNAPSAEQLSHFFKTSPISHLLKVKTPCLFLLGAHDLRVPISNGLQYARALKEHGTEVKVTIFPSDNHSLDRRIMVDWGGGYSISALSHDNIKMLIMPLHFVGTFLILWTLTVRMLLG